MSKGVELLGTEVDFRVFEKTSFDLTIYIKQTQGTTTSAFELAAGDTVKFMVKKDKSDPDSAAKITKELTKEDLTAAKCRLQLSPTDTAIAADRYYYQIYIESGGDKWPVMFGRWIVLEKVPD
jgi:hypothetical protein